jgi:hypothetical protein
MDIEEYSKLINSIRNLSKYGWVYIYSIDNGDTIRKMIHKEWGEFNFGTWLKLKLFTDKWTEFYGIED